ncbi:O-antigen ligase family protein [Marinithermus hydrothermalis]|uniref:O-antigen polymerase n=1 Tax=Marinithermus hydrothermalis (strain DSM 14884 / JCM 11576 / T1) TaxID=869210 RepID=F2NQY1_MARHT|nr:O-antigen ligase family protein [Marinithermus hydrothermalis]AEB12559.1 O-antigen polymerase [Marinithermus hydrothermalis DSM 14884]
MASVTTQQVEKGSHKSSFVLRLALYFILLTPLWWFLGIEQFIWPILGAFLLVLQRRILVFSPIKFLIALISIQIFSIALIEESIRYYTYGRQLLTSIGSVLFLTVVTSSIKSFDDIRFLIRGISLFFTVAGFLGIFAITGFWNGYFLAPIEMFLPESVQSTSYGERIVFKYLGQPGYFTFIGEYIRVSSLWLYPTTYAMAIVAFFPLSLWAMQADKPRYRSLHILAIILMFINLVFTTGRMAMLGLLLGGVYFMFSQKRFFWISVVAVGFVPILFSILEGSHLNSIGNVISSLVVARGEGSFIDRVRIYRATFEGWLERPVLGWGTEQDIEGFAYPAGSHSFWGGTLYKYGLVGLSILLLALWKTWRSIVCSKKKAKVLELREVYNMLRFIQWSFIAVGVNGITDSWDLDSITYLLIWLILGLGIVSSRLIGGKANGKG